MCTNVLEERRSNGMSIVKQLLFQDLLEYLSPLFYSTRITCFHFILMPSSLSNSPTDQKRRRLGKCILGEEKLKMADSVVNRSISQ